MLDKFLCSFLIHRGSAPELLRPSGARVSSPKGRERLGRYLGPIRNHGAYQALCILVSLNSHCNPRDRTSRETEAQSGAEMCPRSHTGTPEAWAWRQSAVGHVLACDSISPGCAFLVCRVGLRSPAPTASCGLTRQDN